ncbi:MAG: VWA domain-containing protein [Bryobacteraceae bacterium]
MATRRALTAFLLAALAGGAQKPAGSPKEDEPATIKVDVDVVNLLCSVRDRKGALISTLGKDDFQVLEEGKEQSIKYFSRETDLPLTLGLLVDVSGSQERLIAEERQAAYQFFQQVLRKKDVAFLISFGSDAELLQDLTGSPSLLQKGLEGLRVIGGVGGLHPGPVPTAGQPRGTVLYDAVYLAATDRLQSEVGRKAMILITDGVDQGSRLKLSEAIEAAQKANAIVYSIYYVDAAMYYRGGFGGPSDSALKRMSEETGGRMFRVDRKNTLSQIFQQIQDEMRSQYSIGYTSADSRQPGQFRKVDVKTRNRDLKVQARKGYYVVGSGG